MPTSILHKRSGLPQIVPSISELMLGELAVNTYNGKVFTKTEQAGVQTIIEVGKVGVAPSGLEAVDDGNGIGYRLIGVDNTFFGDTSEGAITFSLSDAVANPEKGAQGKYSMTIGQYTLAPGEGSFAGGYDSRAYGRSSFAFGYTEARGEYSHAEGRGTVAQNDDMHTQGRYNIGTSPNTIHETGIGYLSSGNITRRNGFEVYTDGRVLAPESTPYQQHQEPKSLVTRDHAVTSREDVNLGAIRIPDMVAMTQNDFDLITPDDDTLYIIIDSSSGGME